jgi:hypothetical protein
MRFLSAGFLPWELAGHTTERFQRALQLVLHLFALRLIYPF